MKITRDDYPYIRGSVKTEIGEVNVYAKVYDDEGGLGQKRGISKLNIWNEKRNIAYYDRGWETRPQGHDEERVFQGVIKRLDNLPSRYRG